MKTVKPMRLGVLTRPFEDERKSFLSVALLVFFPFDQPDRLLPDISMWKLIAAELGAEGVLDECMPKRSAEVLLSARAYPRGAPQPACRVRLQMGGVDRTLYVFGDRTWKLTGPTDPEPFASMPLNWSRAFGGEGFAKNPLGKGAKPVKGEAGETHPMPNVEDPQHLVRSTRDRPDPAALGPIDLTWPQRSVKTGTYDERWMKERYPGFPADFDWTFFNVASEGQRFAGFLRGGEPFSLENMHPDEGTLESRLPTGVARCFLSFKPEADELVEVPTRIDTVWLFPHEKRGIVVYRGVAPVREDDAADVLHLLAAYEAEGAPKPEVHYRRALAERLDTRTAIAVIRDRDLLPEMPPAGAHPDEHVSDMETLLATDRLVIGNAMRGAQKRIDDARAEITRQWDRKELEGHPLDLSGLPERLPPMQDAPSLDDLPDVVEAAMKQAEEAKKKAEASIAEMEANGRALCKEHDLDYDKLVAEAKERERKARRRYSAKDQIEVMESQAVLLENAGMDASELRTRLADPALVEQLVGLEMKLNDAYRRMAHYMEPTLAGCEPPASEELTAGAKARRTFAGCDLTNAVLEGLDLGGIDLEGAFLEGAKLAGANLEKANLRNAVLTRADLTGARLAGADLTSANAGGAVLRGADLTGARLERAVLAKADFNGAKLTGAHLEGADLTETTIEGAVLDGADLKNVMLYKATLTDVSLRRANLTKTVFVQGTFRGVDLTEATCAGTVFMSIDGEGTRFDRADLGSARFVKDASFPRSSFQGARLVAANLRGTNLEGADLSDADLTGADLSEAKLQGANLQRIKAQDALFVRAHLERADLTHAILIQAVLQKAHVDGANFEGANLFRADALRMRGDAETRMQGAFVKRVRVLPEGSGHG
jgi:uncharacterized protein YjbI with pentapeptide repeats